MGQHLQLNTSGMQCIGAYRADPLGAPKGGIVVIQEIFGVNAHIRSVVDRFAALGYVAIAPALFDRLETGVELGYDEAGVQKGKALVTELGIDRPLEDIAAAAEAIESAGHIGVVGYCWGGSVAYLAAARIGLPAVSYYGSRTTAFLDEKPTAPLMFHFGERDHSISAEAIAKHRAVLPNAAIYIYPADHGFNCDARSAYDAPSAALALQRTLAFFDEQLAI